MGINQDFQTFLRGESGDTDLLRETLINVTSQTTSFDTSDFTVPAGCKGAYFHLNVTDASGTSPTLDIRIRRRDFESNNFITLIGGTFSQQTGVNNTDLLIYPGLTDSGNRVVSSVLNGTYFLDVDIAGTTPSFDFTVSVEYIK